VCNGYYRKIKIHFVGVVQFRVQKTYVCLENKYYIRYPAGRAGWD